MNKWKKNISIFLISQMISLIGSSLVQYAITWYITLETKSGIYATVAVICGFVPTFVLSPLAGVWADRYNRKTLIVVADGCIALTTLLLAIAFLLGYNYIWLLFVALAIRGLGGAIQTPALQAMLPDLVPEEHLTRINGIYSSSQSMSNLICPVISGALLNSVRIESIFMIDVVTAIIAIVIMLMFLQVPVNKKINEEIGAMSHLKDGLQYINAQKFLKALFISCILLWLIAGPLMYLPPIQVVRVFGDNVWYLTIIETAAGIGMLAGGILMSIWTGFKDKALTIFAALLIMAGAVMMLGFPKSFEVYLMMLVIMCGMIAVFNTVAITIIQTYVDSQYIGRVFGVITMFSSSLMPLGMLVFGPLADIIAIEYIMIICGIVIVVVACSILLSPALRNLDLIEQTSAN